MTELAVGSMAVGSTVGRPALELHDAFSTYSLHLLNLLDTYTFESVQTCPQTFVRIRLSLKQDDPGRSPQAGQPGTSKSSASACSSSRPWKRERAPSSRPFGAWTPNICRAWQDGDTGYEITQTHPDRRCSARQSPGPWAAGAVRTRRCSRSRW